MKQVNGRGPSVLAALALCCGAGCSEEAGDAQGDTPGVAIEENAAPSGPAAAGGSSDAASSSSATATDAPFDVCEDNDYTLYRDIPPGGTARLTLPAAEGETQRELVEVVCQTFHDASGQPIRFGASFYSEWDDRAFVDDRALVFWDGEFTGDGEYEGARFSYVNEDDREAQDSGRLSLSAGGARGSFVGDKGYRLDFECADAGRISAGPVTFTEAVAPGELRLVTGDGGIVYELPTVSCGTLITGDFALSGAVNSPFGIELRADGSGPGSHRFSLAGIDYGGFRVSFAGSIELSSCTGTPSGTIAGRGDGPTTYQGLFVCPR